MSFSEILYLYWLKTGKLLVKSIIQWWCDVTWFQSLNSCENYASPCSYLPPQSPTPRDIFHSQRIQMRKVSTHFAHKSQYYVVLRLVSVTPTGANIYFVIGVGVIQNHIQYLPIAHIYTNILAMVIKMWITKVLTHSTQLNIALLFQKYLRLLYDQANKGKSHGICGCGCNLLYNMRYIIVW